MMTDYEEKIAELQEELRNTKYNKATQHHIGELKAKIARLREEQELQRKKGGDTSGYDVRRSGDATVAMVGFPSVGKSTLLNVLTNADSEVASYEFTTLDVVPGMMPLRGVQVQLLDVPGLVEGASSGRGRGKEVLSVVRSADMVLVVVDAMHPGQEEDIRDELYEAGLRLDQDPPAVRVEKKGKGGLSFRSNVDLNVDIDVLADVARELGYLNADIVLGEDVSIDRFIDALEDNRAYLPSITVYNKADLVDTNVGVRDDGVYVSAAEESGLEALRERIWDSLDVIRVYTKEPGEEVDWDEPLVVEAGCTVEQACKELHRDIARRFKFARVTGSSADFDEQQVSEDHVLADGDVLEIHTS